MNVSWAETEFIWTTCNIKQDLWGNVEVLKNKKHLRRLTRPILGKTFESYIDIILIACLRTCIEVLGRILTLTVQQ